MFDELNLLGQRPNAGSVQATVAPRCQVRARLQNLTTNLKVDDVGFLYGDSFTTLEGDTPNGIELSKNELAVLVSGDGRCRASSTVSCTPRRRAAAGSAPT